jgi:hypothetical protein
MVGDRAGLLGSLRSVPQWFFNSFKIQVVLTCGQGKLFQVATTLI